MRAGQRAGFSSKKLRPLGVGDDDFARTVSGPAADELGLTVLRAEVLQAFEAGMRRQSGFSARANVGMKARIERIERAEEPVREKRPREALTDRDGIVAEGRPDFSQHTRGLCFAGHAIDLGPELPRADRNTPLDLQRLRLQERVLG